VSREEHVCIVDPVSHGEVDRHHVVHFRVQQIIEVWQLQVMAAHDARRRLAEDAEGVHEDFKLHHDLVHESQWILLFSTVQLTQRVPVSELAGGADIKAT